MWLKAGSGGPLTALNCRAEPEVGTACFPREGKKTSQHACTLQRKEFRGENTISAPKEQSERKDHFKNR